MLEHLKPPGIVRRHTVSKRQATSNAGSGGADTSAAGSSAAATSNVGGGGAASTRQGASSTAAGGAGGGQQQTTSEQQQQQTTSQQQQQQPPTTQQQVQPATTQQQQQATQQAQTTTRAAAAPSTSSTQAAVAATSSSVPVRVAPVATPSTTIARSSVTVDLTTSVQVVSGRPVSSSSSASPTALNGAGDSSTSSSGLSTTAVAAISVIGALAGVAVLFWIGVQMANAKRRRREAAQMGEIDFDPSGAGGTTDRSAEGSVFGDGDPLHAALGITRSTSGLSKDPNGPREMGEFGGYEHDEERDRVYGEYMHSLAPPLPPPNNAPPPPTGLTRQPTNATMLSRQPTNPTMYHHHGPSNASSLNHLVGAGADGWATDLQRQNTVMTQVSSNGAGNGLSRQGTLGGSSAYAGMGTYSSYSHQQQPQHYPLVYDNGYPVEHGYHPHQYQQYPFDMRYHTTSPVGTRQPPPLTRQPSRELYNPARPISTVGPLPSAQPSHPGTGPGQGQSLGSRSSRRSLRNYGGAAGGLEALVVTSPRQSQSIGANLTTTTSTGAAQASFDEVDLARRALANSSGIGAGAGAGGMGVGSGMARSESVGTVREDLATGLAGNLRLVEH